MGLFSNDDKRKPAQKFGKSAILVSLGAYLAANIPPEGAAEWELAVYTGLLFTLHNVLKYQFGLKIPFLDD
jgi:hypothetical protein